MHLLRGSREVMNFKGFAHSGRRVAATLEDLPDQLLFICGLESVVFLVYKISPAAGWLLGVLAAVGVAVLIHIARENNRRNPRR